mmetsp:Transcript_26584/g.85907  ORF Transcript_26584/g.85907 Transcript_26584/m.85907 type:complete len:230 (-) Transcript_26584:275-964(-)
METMPRGPMAAPAALYEHIGFTRGCGACCTNRAAGWLPCLAPWRARRTRFFAHRTVLDPMAGGRARPPRGTWRACFRASCSRPSSRGRSVSTRSCRCSSQTLYRNSAGRSSTSAPTAPPIPPPTTWLRSAPCASLFLRWFARTPKTASGTQPPRRPRPSADGSTSARPGGLAANWTAPAAGSASSKRHAAPGVVATRAVAGPPTAMERAAPRLSRRRQSRAQRRPRSKT